MPANFKTEAAQSRLLAAVIAAHPSLKLDYKALSLHYGSNRTSNSLEHFFRPIKRDAATLRAIVQRGEDPLDHDLDSDAAVGEGRDPASVANPGLPGGGKTGATPSKTPRKRAANGTPSTRGTGGGTNKRARVTASSVLATPSKRAVKKEKRSSDDDEDGEESAEVDYSELDEAPIEPRPVFVNEARVMEVTGFDYNSGSSNNNIQAAKAASAATVPWQMSTPASEQDFPTLPNSSSNNNNNNNNNTFGVRAATTTKTNTSATNHNGNFTLDTSYSVSSVPTNSFNNHSPYSASAASSGGASMDNEFTQAMPSREVQRELSVFTLVDDDDEGV